MKVFISQPMRDKTNEQIEKEREDAISYVRNKLGAKEVEVIDSFFKNAPHEAKPLWFLGKSFELLSTADVAVFIGDWINYRGCNMEYKACREYGIKAVDLNLASK